MRRIRRMGKGNHSMLLEGGPYSGATVKLDNPSCTLAFTAKGMHGKYVRNGDKIKTMEWQEL